MRALCDFLATGGYAGRIPFAPGTWGSAVAVLIAWGALTLRPELAELSSGVLLALLLLVIAIAVADYAYRNALYGEGSKDPKQIVIDEIAGYFVSIIGIGAAPAHWSQAGSLIAAFFLFRLFDITKPPPARQLERLRGGYGIVMDDIAAGVYANLALRALYLIW